MRIHHLSCGSLCPHGGRLVGGKGGVRSTAEIVCHCLAIESGEGVVLVDTGFGTEDARNRRQLGPVYGLMNARPRIETTALRQLEALGFAAADVRHIVATHLDPDHSGGLPDFPAAAVHVFAAELEAALHPRLRDRPRYPGTHWKHGPRWVRHESGGEDWFGFESVRILPGAGAEIALVPLHGHSLGHSGVAIRTAEGWLLHCGDAYFNHAEVETPATCPRGLRLFQNLTAADNRARRSNQERLRELADRRGGQVTLLCSHDPHELEREQARSNAALAAA
jgi:glyoxylase-like metal-dependent hydrolase (beta-lactamase superfamily II)